MASAPVPVPEGTAQKVVARSWQEYAFHAYARIVARKHGLAAPTLDLTSLSDEELETSLATVRDLAHLPPG
jgi:hypothetical protein